MRTANHHVYGMFIAGIFQVSSWLVTGHPFDSIGVASNVVLKAGTGVEEAVSGENWLV